jgi:hypothetical protein
MAENKMDFFSCDANEPMVDSIEIGDVKFFDNGDNGRCAALLFGSDRIHALDDVWRRFALTQGGFSGTPPISYIINQKVKKRYDFIYSTSQYSPIGVQYLLEDSLLATSDHALVIADFEFN